MKISRVTFAVLATAVLIVFAIQPVAKAGQGLDLWRIEDVKGDSSTGCLTIYYQIVGYDESYGQELALMVFSLRIYQKNTRTWHLINGVADRTVLLMNDATQKQRDELQDFLDDSVFPKLCPTATCDYNSIHLTGVENDYHNLSAGTYGSKDPYYPPYVVSADVTLVVK